MKFTASVLVIFSAISVRGFTNPQPAAFRPQAQSIALNVATTSDVQAKTKAPVFDEVCETTGVTLKRFMSEVATLNPELTELTILFGAIETSCKAIANLVRRSQLPSSETLGYQGEVNVQGEDQKKLDVITNDLLKRALRFTGRLGVLASEEEDTPVDLMPTNPGDKEVLIDESEKYVAVFDPLDGSSNVDAGIPTGKKIRTQWKMEHFPQFLNNLHASGTGQAQLLESMNTMKPAKSTQIALGTNAWSRKLSASPTRFDLAPTWWLPPIAFTHLPPFWCLPSDPVPMGSP